MTVVDDEMQQTVEQGEIGSGGDSQEQVGLVGRRGTTRVDDDQLRSGLDSIHHPQEQDRMAVGHVGTGHEEHVGVVEVLVRAGRAVRSQRLLVAGACARHAQPRVRFDPVRADEPLREFVRQVLRLERHLPRHVERNGVGPVFVDDDVQAPCGIRDRGLECDRNVIGAALRAHTRSLETTTPGEHRGTRRTFRAQTTPVGGVVLVAVRGLDGSRACVRIDTDLEHHPASHAAIRAGGPHQRGRVLHSQLLPGAVS